MKARFSLAILIGLAVITQGCRSPEHSQKNESTGSAGEQSQTTSPPQPTTIKPNRVDVEARVESLIVVNNTMFSIHLRINSAVGVEGMESLSPGQVLVTSPEYASDSHGHLETEHPRNKRLLDLRTLTTGDTISAQLSLAPNGQWMLIDGSRK